VLVDCRLSEQARRQLEKSNTKFEDLSLGDRRPTQLIRRYGNLYTEGRLDALDALDDVTEMTEFTDLKGKLLLTILVVSFAPVAMRPSFRQPQCSNFIRPTSICCRFDVQLAPHNYAAV